MISLNTPVLILWFPISPVFSPSQIQEEDLVFGQGTKGPRVAAVRAELRAGLSSRNVTGSWAAALYKL